MKKNISFAPWRNPKKKGAMTACPERSRRVKPCGYTKIIVYHILKAIFAVLTKLLFRTRVEGRENIPKKAPFIIASNHSSFADVSLIALSVPFMVRWITRSDVYSIRLLKPFHDLLGSIVANGSVKKALEALKKGDVVGIFPEGTRTSDGTLKEANTGVAIIALKSGVPVIPIGISGAFEAFPWNAKLPRFHRVLVRIGPPISFPKYNNDEEIDEDILKKVASEIMGEIEKQLAADRDYY